MIRHNSFIIVPVTMSKKTEIGRLAFNSTMFRIQLITYLAKEAFFHLKTHQNQQNLEKYHNWDK